MKILLVNKFFYPKGGSEISFFETAKLLEERGHKVVFFAMEHPDNLPSSYAKFFVSRVDYEGDGSVFEKVKVAERLLYSFESKRKIRSLIEEEKIDIVHLNNIHHQISPSILHTFKNFNLPLVMSLRDYKMVCPTYSLLAKGTLCDRCRGGKYYWCFLNHCSKDSYLKSALNTLEMYLHHKILHIYELVDTFISPSLFLKKKIREMGFKGEVIHLPNFVKLTDFQPSYDYKKRPIIYFGRLSREKGLFTLLKGVEGLHLKLRIIGDGPLRKELERKVKGDKSNKVFFAGHKQSEELRKEIRESMFVVLPSECYENSPRTVIEAFALGKPVIGARTGGIPELVRDGETGLTFEAGNTGDLRDKIGTLLKNPQVISQMGRRARRWVEEEFNPEKHYQGLMEIYRKAILRHTC